MFPKVLVFLSIVFSCGDAKAQSDTTWPQISEMQSILFTLASDNMKGRENYTVELFQAARFIANKFDSLGLLPYEGKNSFLLPHNEKRRKKRDTSSLINPERILFNVCGVLPGKSKPKEIIIISAHYDHIGIKGGQVYNGANDNASGVTAMLMLAEYYARRADNERTIMFCAFSGEELGLWGSSVLAAELNSSFIYMVVNLEMLGKTNVGKNSVFITGDKKSSFAKMFREALKGKLNVLGDHSGEADLYSRSDNYPFALNGIVSHTIMSSDDTDRCYHRACDDAYLIDFQHLKNVIQSIPQGLKTFVMGQISKRELKKRS